MDGNLASTWYEGPGGDDGSPHTFLPMFVNHIKAGDREVLNIELTTPIHPVLTQFTIDVWINESIIDDEPGQPPPALTSCQVAGANQLAACVFAVISHFLNVYGLVAPPGATACVDGALASAIGTVSSLASNVACGVGSAKDFALNNAQGVFSSLLGASLGCYEKLLSKVNPLLSVYQVYSGVMDLQNACGPYFRKKFPKSKLVQLIFPKDPNTKTGPNGTDALGFINGEDPLAYDIEFENRADASAAAQVVTVTDQLDPSLVDLSTFSFGPVGFGGTSIDPPIDATSFSRDVDLRPAMDLLVRASGHLDTTTGLVSWEFRSLDPATGLPTTDPLAGFLPPNVDGTSGHGSVVFFVSPRPEVPEGAEIRNRARIVFDANDPIDTPDWVNVVDREAPTSHMSALADQQAASSFSVAWAGADATSGILNYDVYVSTDGGAFQPWQVESKDTSALFTGQAGHSYGFYCVARDRAGHTEVKTEAAEITTAVPSILIGLETASLSAGEGAGTVTVSVTRSGDTGDPVSIGFTTIDGTAVAGADYTAVSGTLDFAAGETTRTIVVPIAEDDEVEADEQFQVSLTDGAPGVVLTAPQAVVTILDNEPPVLTVPADVTVEAGSPAGAVVTFDATAMSHIDGPIVATCAPASGATFLLGPTTVTCTAVDSRGDTAAATFVVTVADTTAPASEATPSGPTGANGWFTGGGVSVALHATDAVGVAVIRYAAQRRPDGRTRSTRGRRRRGHRQRRGPDDRHVPGARRGRQRRGRARPVGGDRSHAAARDLRVRRRRVARRQRRAGLHGFRRRVRTGRPGRRRRVLAGHGGGRRHRDGGRPDREPSGVRRRRAVRYCGPHRRQPHRPAGAGDHDYRARRRRRLHARPERSCRLRLRRRRIGRRQLRRSRAVRPGHRHGDGGVEDVPGRHHRCGRTRHRRHAHVYGRRRRAHGDPGRHARPGLRGRGARTAALRVRRRRATPRPRAGEPPGPGPMPRRTKAATAATTATTAAGATRTGAGRAGSPTGSRRPPSTPSPSGTTRRSSRRSKPRAAADSVRFSGRGRWNGKAGYTFEALATDMGEPGRHRDTLTLTIRDSHGVIVASIDGPIDGGNIQSERIGRR